MAIMNNHPTGSCRGARTRSTLCDAARILSFLLFVSALWPGETRLAAQTPTIALVHVEVVPMDSARTLPDQTVIVENGRITQVGPSGEVTLPTAATVIDGSGLYLAPGLADMHAHFTTDPSPDFLVTFLATGTTTVRNLNALPEHLEWKRRVLTGDLVGPTIFTSGPGIAGPPDPILVWQFWAIQLFAVLVLGLLGRTAALRFVRGMRGPDGTPRIGGWLPWTAGLVVLAAVMILAGVVPLATFARLSFPQAYIVDSEARARAEVDRQAAAGFDLVKIYDYMRPGPASTLRATSMRAWTPPSKPGSGKSSTWTSSSTSTPSSPSGSGTSSRSHSTTLASLPRWKHSRNTMWP